MGKGTGATDVVEDAGVFARMTQLQNDKGEAIRAMFYGYETAHGRQIAVLLIPKAVADNDPRLEQADAFVKQLGASRFEVVLPAAPAAPPPGYAQQGPPPGYPPPGSQGAALAYHAKTIPPPERDVAITGVFLNVGFASGPTWGGVGTSVQYGQHPVTQLLLLYANGVAAKVDMKSGNLMGKYEAEGFASLDVTDPAQTSGSNFGRWQRANGAVQIRWNSGAGSMLAQNGPNLEAQGERWTPFTLADGVRLRGLFVRKMEAGLRSQAIALREDGAFEADGVNVTMGGAMVSPAFPERGGGRYEIRKGSLILYFANGFTQAIACTLDPNGPDARMVVLNGFPFERVQ
jgi:hypothetical protein